MAEDQLAVVDLLVQTRLNASTQLQATDGYSILGVFLGGLIGGWLNN